MATRVSKAIQPTNNTDADMRAWSKFIFDTMITGGWVQTADTGQIDFTTVTKPTAANQARGYFIVRMADTLQATVPIFVRIDIGSSSAINAMGVWITIGAGSDGAGTITTKYLNSPTGSPPPIGTNSNSSTVVRPMSFGSAGGTGSRVHICIGLDIDAPSASFAIAFSLERTKSSSGEDSAEGIVLYYSSSSASWNRSQYLFASQVPQPPVEQGLAHVHGIRTPGAQSQNVGGSIPFPIAGITQQPVKGVLVIRAGDWTIGHRQQALVYGALITYQALFGQRITFEGQDSSALVLMRFD